MVNPPPLPIGGPICVNSRDNPIPREIVAVNTAAHAAMRESDSRHGVTSDPFLHYKLLNVQYLPLDKTAPGLYMGDDPGTGANPASFFLANGVVETDRSLQLFSGGLLPRGTISDFTETFFASPPPATHKNTAYGGLRYDMGGCMGCHGSQGQSQGGDFSVITARGSVSAPEAPQPVPGTSTSTLLRANLALPAFSNRNRSIIGPPK